MFFYESIQQQAPPKIDDKYFYGMGREVGLNGRPKPNIPNMPKSYNYGYYSGRVQKHFTDNKWKYAAGAGALGAYTLYRHSQHNRPNINQMVQKAQKYRKNIVKGSAIAAGAGIAAKYLLSKLRNKNEDD